MAKCGRISAACTAYLWNKRAKEQSSWHVHVTPAIAPGANLAQAAIAATVDTQQVAKAAQAAIAGILAIAQAGNPAAAIKN